MGLQHRHLVISTVFLCAGVLVQASRGDGVAIVSVKDNTLFSNGNSNGAGGSVFCGRTGNGIRQRAVLAFDVAGHVPAGSTITSVSLDLTLTAASPNGFTTTHALHRIGRDWGEGTSSAIGGSGAAPTPGDATWTNTFFPDQFWSSSGGDFNPAASGSAVVGVDAPAPVTWASTPAMVADVQYWLDNPAGDFGWLIMGNEATGFSAKKFGSREWGFPGQLPTLNVEFDPPAACPEDCFDQDGQVGVTDFLELLAQWGTEGSCDLDGGGVGVTDFLALLAAWGPCP